MSVGWRAGEICEGEEEVEGCCVDDREAEGNIERLCDMDCE